MRVHNYTIFVFMLMFAHLSNANDVDLDIQLSPTTVAEFTDGDTGEFIITITNNGTEDAGLLSTSQLPIAIDSDIIFLENNRYFVEFTRNNNIQQDCQFVETAIDPIPGQPPASIFSFFTSVIPAQSTITCYGIYLANFNLGIRSIDWTVNSTLDTDIDDSNNQITMRFFGSLTPVPGLSIFGVISLILLFIFFAIKRR